MAERAASLAVGGGSNHRSLPPTVDPERASSFEVFYRETYQTAMRYVLSRVSRPEAEEITADAYLVTWSRWDKEGELGYAWLFAVLRNKIGDHYRRAARVTPTETFDLEDPDSSFSENADLRAVIRTALKRLPPAHAEAIVLAYWCDLPVREAAAAAGCSQTAFRVRLSRARRRLARTLNDQGGYLEE